ncbi:MAG TPA: hypothetical protein VHA33_06515 [Candidatus Angelobacter sp.]|jgi:hypothetical protein|nr:hypothetical protein [Candidatus Angelobacter sp.]
MKSNPPALATWLLDHFCAVANKDALAGDLLEQYQQGRPAAWYWRQVMTAIQWWRHGLVLAFYAGVSWYCSRLAAPPVPIRWSLDFAIMMLVLWASDLSGRFLPGIWQAMLVFLCICWTYGPRLLPYQNFYRGLEEHYSFVLMVALINLVCYREKGFPAFSLREVWKKDPIKQRARRIFHLEQTISEEPDPQLRKRYEQALKALKEKPVKR